MTNMYDYIAEYIPETTCIKKKENNDFLIVMSEQTEIFYLNDTAKFIYENIDGKRSIKEILELIKQEYDVSNLDDNLLKKDLIEMVRDFQWQRIIKLKEAY